MRKKDILYTEKKIYIQKKKENPSAYVSYIYIVFVSLVKGKEDGEKI